jgi:hypothetical protein
LPENRYIKRPNLIRFKLSKTTETGDIVPREVAILETLRAHPHPKIEEYIGCKVHDSRIIGICFVKYSETLAKRENPGHHGKPHFMYSDSQYSPEDCEGFISGVERGIRQLYLLDWFISISTLPISC